jgi:hypothetical protein
MDPGLGRRLHCALGRAKRHLPARRARERAWVRRGRGVAGAGCGGGTRRHVSLDAGPGDWRVATEAGAGVATGCRPGWPDGQAPLRRRLSPAGGGVRRRRCAPCFSSRKQCAHAESFASSATVSNIGVSSIITSPPFTSRCTTRPRPRPGSSLIAQIPRLMGALGGGLGTTQISGLGRAPVFVLLLAAPGVTQATPLVTAARSPRARFINADPNPLQARALRHLTQ